MRELKAVAAIAVSFAVLSAPLSAQELDYSSFLTIPLIAETPSYRSQIFIHNPTLADSQIVVSYVGATGTATPGPVVCNTVTVPAGNVVKTSLGAICPLNAGANFGTLMTSQGFVALYTRVQTPSGNGFSVEGMMDFNCCSGIREVVGLVRQAAAPSYQSNCFVLNQEARAGRVVVTLVGGGGEAIVTQVVNLGPGEFIRLLDVFAALGAAAGDYTNVRASFESIVPVEGGSPVGFTASCTVQNNTSFDADFRVAKYHL